MNLGSGWVGTSPEVGGRKMHVKKLLADAGASCDQANGRGGTPVQLAIANGHADTLLALLGVHGGGVAAATP